MVDSVDLLSARHFRHATEFPYPNDVKDGDIVTLDGFDGVFIIRSVPDDGGSLDACPVCVFAGYTQIRCDNYHYMCTDFSGNRRTAVRIEHV